METVAKIWLRSGMKSVACFWIPDWIWLSITILMMFYWEFDSGKVELQIYMRINSGILILPKPKIEWCGPLFTSVL